MDDLDKVIDPESENHCDLCGEKIEPGDIYYAKDDDRMILCVKCFNAFTTY